MEEPTQSKRQPFGGAQDRPDPQGPPRAVGHAEAQLLADEALQLPSPEARAAKWIEAGAIYEDKLAHPEKALIMYQRALKETPASAPVLSRVRRAYQGTRRFTAARAALDQARGKVPAAELAQEYAALGAHLADEPLDHDLAEECLAAAVALDPAAPVAQAKERIQRIRSDPRSISRALRAEAVEERDRGRAALLYVRIAEISAVYEPEKVQDALDRAFLLKPGLPAALELLERLAARTGDWGRLAGSLLALAEKNKDRAAAVDLALRLALVRMARLGDKEGALAAYIAACDADPAHPAAAAGAFELMLESRRYEDAAKLMERHVSAAVDERSRSLARMALAELYTARLKDPRAAKKHLEAAVRADPANTSAARALVEVCRALKDAAGVAAALEALSLASGSTEERVAVLEKLADAYAQAERPDEAARALARAVVLDPRKRRLQNRMLKLGAGANEELARALEQAAGAAKEPPTASALWSRAAEVLEIENAPRAIAAWKKAVLADPTDKNAHEALAALEARTPGAQDPVAVADGLVRALSKDPADAALALRTAGALSAAGKPAEAADAFTRALRGPPAVAGEARLKLAALYTEPLKKPAEAAQLYIQALAEGAMSVAVPALEKLLEAGVAEKAITLALEPYYREAEDAPKLAALLERRARVVSPDERGILWLKAAAIHEEELFDLRSAFDCAGRALRADPMGPASRGELERLAKELEAWPELVSLYSETALIGRLSEAEAVVLTLRAAELAEAHLPAADASAAYRDVLARAPKHVGALQGMARTAGESGRDDERAEALRRLIEETSEPAARAALLADHADALEKAGKHAEAAAALKEAMRAPGADKKLLRMRLHGALQTAGKLDELAAVLGEEADEARLAGDAEGAARAARARADLLARSGKGTARQWIEVLEVKPTDGAALSALRQLLGDNAQRLEAARALARAAQVSGDLEVLAAGLEVVAAAEPEAAARVAALRSLAGVRASLGRRDQAFASLAQALALAPTDLDLRAEVRRAAEAADALDAVAEVYADVLEELTGPAALGLERELAELCERRLGDRPRATERYRRMLAIDPENLDALRALHRLLRAGGEAADLADVCFSLADVVYEAEERLALYKEAGGAYEKAGRHADASRAYQSAAEAAPQDREALSALDRASTAAGDHQTLAWALARRRELPDAGHNLDLAFRLAEVRRTALRDAAAALVLYKEVLAGDPSHAGARAGLDAIARSGAPEARDAARALESAAKSSGEPLKRVEALELQLGSERDAAARKTIHAEIRRVYESEAGQKSLAFGAACRAFAEHKDDATRADLERLARETGSMEELCGVYEDAADGLPAGDATAVDLRRRLARVLESELKDVPAALDSWRKVQADAPGDAESLEALSRLLTEGQGAKELVDVLRAQRDRAADAPARAAAGLELGKLLADKVGDLEAATSVLREAATDAPADDRPLAALEPLYERARQWTPLCEVLARRAELADLATRAKLLTRLAEVRETELSDAEGAVSALEGALKAVPGNAPALAALRRLLGRPESRARAAALAEGALRESGDAAGLSEVLEARLENERAPAVRRKLLDEVAELQTRLGRAPLAFAARCRAFREMPEDDALRAELRALADRTGSHDELAGVLEDAVERQPGAAWAARALRDLAAVCEGPLAEPQRAAAAVEALLRAVPGDLSAEEAAVRLWRAAGKPAELATACMRLAARVTDPERAKDLYFEAATLREERLDDKAGAIESLVAVTRLDPADRAAPELLARIYEEAERWDALADLLSRSVHEAREPGVKAALNVRLGRLCAQRISDPQRAASCYRAALVAQPGDAASVAAMEELLTGPARRTAAEVLLPLYEARGEHRKKAVALESLAQEAAPAERPRLYLALARLQAEQLGSKDMAFLSASRALREAPGEYEALTATVRYAEETEAFEEEAAILTELADRPEGAQTRVAYRRELARLFEGPLADPARALEEHARLLALAPGDVGALAALSRLNREVPEPAKLLEILRKQAAVVEDPEARREILAEVAQLQELRLSDYAGAVATWRRVLEKAPHDPAALAALDRLLTRQERWVELAEVLAQELPIADRARDERAMVDLRWRLGYLREERLGDVRGAAALYAEVLERDPGHEETRARLEALLARDPARAEIAAALEKAYQEAGDFARYAQMLEARAGAAGEASDRKTALLALAGLQEIRLGRPEIAFLTLCRAFREEPRDAQVQRGMERLADLASAHEELASIYEEELDRIADPAIAADVARKLGQLCEERINEPERAVVWLEKALELRPDDPRPLAPLDRLYRHAEKWPELARVLEREAAVTFDPHERAAFFFRLGQVHEEKLADRAAAVDAFEEIVEKDPGHMPAQRALERLAEGTEDWGRLAVSLKAQHERAGDQNEKDRLAARLAEVLSERLNDVDGALALWREVLAHHKRSEAGHAAVEKLLERAGRWQELADHLQARRAASIDPREQGKLDERLGRILGERLGDAEGAAKKLEAALEKEPRNLRALAALKDLHARAGRSQERLSVLRKMLPLCEEPAAVKAVRLEMAEVLAAQPEPNRDAALEHTRRALDQGPHAQAELERAEAVFRKLEAMEDVARVLELRAAQIDPGAEAASLTEILFGIAGIHAGAGKVEGGQKALERILQVDPSNKKAFEALRAIYTQTEQWRDLASLLEASAAHVKSAEERCTILLAAAEIAEHKLAQPEKAFLCACRAFKDAPADPRALEAVARLAGPADAREELAEVYEDAARALSAEPLAASLWLRLARLRGEELNDAEGARGAVGEILAIEPENLDALRALAALESAQGRHRESADALVRIAAALAVVPGKRAALADAAATLAGRAGDAEGALVLWLRILELDARDAEAGEEVASILSSLGRHEDLVAHLGRLRDLAVVDAGRAAVQRRIAEVLEGALGDMERALDAYQTLWSLSPAAAAPALERLYIRLERWSELGALYEKVAELTESREEQIAVFFKLAGVREEHLADPAGAAAAFERVLALDPQSRPALKGLFRLCQELGEWQRCVDTAHRLIPVAESREEAMELYLSIAEIWYEKLKRSDKAELTYQQVLKLDPGSRAAIHALGQIYERSGNWPYAMEMIQREAELSGAMESVALHLRLGQIQEDVSGDLAAARISYRRALEIDSGYRPAITALKRIAETSQDADTTVEALEREATAAPDPAERARLLCELGRYKLETMNDADGAVRAYEEAFARSPGFLDAARALSDLYVAREDWEKAETALDAVVRGLPESETGERARALYRLGYVSDKRGKPAAALDAYQKAYALDPTYLPAMEGLGAALVRAGAHAEAQSVYSSLLVHHGSSLSDLEVAEIYSQIGAAAETMGQLDKAQKSYEKAVGIDSAHGAARDGLARVLEAGGRFDEAVEHRFRLAERAQGEEKARLLAAIGRTCDEKLSDPYQAIDAWRGALAAVPGNREALGALADLYEKTRQASRAVETLEQLAAQTDSPAQERALHLCRAAALCRDEIHDAAKAAALFEGALDVDPFLIQAFADLEALLAAGKKWRELSEAYVRMIQRLPKTRETLAARLGVWKAMGELCRRALKDPDGAIEAYGVVVRAAPDDLDAARSYAELLSSRPGREAEAAAAWRSLVAGSAEPGPAARAIAVVWHKKGDLSRAYAAAQVARLLGASGADEDKIIQAAERRASSGPGRPLAARAFETHVLHPKAKGPMAELLALVGGAWPAFGKDLKEFGVGKKDRLDVAGSLLAYAIGLREAAQWLGVKLPEMYLHPTSDAPATPVGSEQLCIVGSRAELKREWRPAELRFYAARIAALCRPELALARALPLDQLGALYAAALSAAGQAPTSGVDAREAEKLGKRIAKLLDSGARETLAALGADCAKEAADLRGFVEGAELTALRAGALAAGDFTAVRTLLGEDKGPAARIPLRTKLRDLALYGLSDDFAHAREAMGLAMADGGGSTLPPAQAGRLTTHGATPTR